VPQPISLKTLVSAQDQVAADVASETIILSTKAGEYYSLDPVAAFVSDHRTEPVAVGDIWWIPT